MVETQTERILNHMETLTSLDQDLAWKEFEEFSDMIEDIGGDTEKGFFYQEDFLPYSQLRITMEGTVYMSEFLYAKLY